MGLQSGDVAVAGILHPAVGMMDETAGDNVARQQGHVQSLQGEACAKVRRHRPTHHAPAVGIEDDRQIGEVLGETHIGDVRNPELVDGRGLELARQIGIDAEAVVAVRRCRNERPASQAQQIVLAHQPQNPLVVDAPALALEQRRDPAIAVMPLRKRQALDRVAQLGFLQTRRRGPPMPVVARPAHLQQGTHPLHRQSALPLRPGLDEAMDAVPPDRSLGRREVSKSCKACLKKSASNACWPTLRSNSAIRPRATESSSASAMEPSPSGSAFRKTRDVKVRAPMKTVPLRGRPRPRSASSPPARKAARHSYSSLRPTCSSRERAETFSPLSNRHTAETLNSWLNDRDLLIRYSSSHQNCPLFICLTLGVHSNPPRSTPPRR